MDPHVVEMKVLYKPVSRKYRTHANYDIPPCCVNIKLIYV
jgi:hypothetical protein